jgi:ferritin-like metal-binding protein YciE
MTTPEQKIVQYLNEAHATEAGLVRVLQSQIAMTPRGSYRTALENHLAETRDHAERVQRRLGQLRQAGNPANAAVGLFESMVSQTLAMWKTPLDLLRGTSGEEKVLKNAKDAAATEALEIATYRALEELAKAAGDEDTAKLAASIRGDEERMLERIQAELPKLARAVLGGGYDVAKTGAADTVRKTAKRTTKQARKAPGAARGASRAAGSRTARGASRAAGSRTTRAASGGRGAVATAGDLPIPRYDSLTADEVVAKLPELSQAELTQVDAYERRHGDRATVRQRVDALKGSEPWPGYDGQTVEEITRALSDADDARAKAARDYERAHKNRAGVLSAAERELTTA